MFKKKGFTLIELVMIIVILGILAAVAIPRFYDLATQAKQSAEEGVVGGVRAGIMTYYANWIRTVDPAYPDELDDSGIEDCDVDAPCFDRVLAQGGITKDWKKLDDTGPDIYQGPYDRCYAYDFGEGSFLGTTCP